MAQFFEKRIVRLPNVLFFLLNAIKWTPQSLAVKTQS